MFRPCGDEFLFQRWKRNQKIAGGYNAASDAFGVYLLAPSPEPPWKSAALRLSGVAKIAELAATLHLGQKSVSFYGSNMIRPPRWAAKTATASIHALWPAGAANAEDFKKKSFSALFFRSTFPPAGGKASPVQGEVSVPCHVQSPSQQADSPLCTRGPWRNAVTGPALVPPAGGKASPVQGEVSPVRRLVTEGL